MPTRVSAEWQGFDVDGYPESKGEVAVPSWDEFSVLCGIVERLLDACEEHGFDPEGPDSLVGVRQRLSAVRGLSG